MSRLFVYGTLRPCNWHDGKVDRQIIEALNDKARYCGAARVRGRFYRVDWYPAFVPDEKAPWVNGDLFDVLDPAGLFPLLDRFEEVGPDFPAPQEYNRVRCRVTAGGDSVVAWVYAYGRATTGLVPIDDGDFIV